MNFAARNAFCFLGFLLLLVTQPGRGQITNIDFSLGRAKYHESNWAGAITNFSAAIEAAYDLWNSYSYRAYARSKIGDTSGALADCAEAIKLNPTFSGGHFWRARIFLNLTNYDAALANFSAGMRLGPQNCPADLATEISGGFSARSMRCLKAGDIAGVISNLNVKVFLTPTNSNEYAFRSMMKLFQHNFGPALVDVETALRHNQDDYLAHVIRAWVRLEFDDASGSAEDCRQTLAFMEQHQTNSRPEIWQADKLMNEGLLALTKGEKQEASEKFKQSMDAFTRETNTVPALRDHWRQLMDEVLAKAPQKKKP